MRNEPIEFTKKSLTAISLIASTISDQKNERARHETIEAYRSEQKKIGQLRILPAFVSVSTAEISGVKCEWAEPSLFRKKDKVIIYIHGGAWIFGGMDSARPFAAQIAKESKIPVLSIDYRLAPEHAYPAGLEDCLLVYESLIENGYDPKKISILGDSAGGNLSLCLINILKEKGKPMPACVACISPVTDMRLESNIVQSHDDLIYTIINNKEEDIFSIYLGDEYIDKRHLSTISPITADLSGLPPVLIHTGGSEPISVDNIAYGRKMHVEGGIVKVKVWFGMFHDFTLVGGLLKESRKSIKEISKFFNEKLK